MHEKPNRICELQRKHGISQERLAEELNVSRASVSLYENDSNIPVDILKAIAEYFGITIDYESLICEFLHKHKITLLFSVLGFIFLLISPNFVYKDFLQRLKSDGAVIENEMIFGDGIWHKVIMHRSAAFVIMLICYVLLILISLIRISLSSNTSTSSPSDSTDDSKVDLNK